MSVTEQPTVEFTCLAGISFLLFPTDFFLFSLEQVYLGIYGLFPLNNVKNIEFCWAAKFPTGFFFPTA